VTAVLIPDGDNWRRIATVSFADPFLDVLNTPSSFATTERELVNHSRYRAVFRAMVTDNHGSYTENEAQLRVINKRPVMTISFVSRSRDCSAPPTIAGKPHTAASGCSVLTRWLQADPADPFKQFILISASGRIPAHEAVGAIVADPIFGDAHLRTFDCQPFLFSEQTEHFEPTGASLACSAK
jgi:hypothetical protein